MRILNAEFVKSMVAVDETDGTDMPEVCFVGRSNVGKSSMINSLVVRKVARTSSTPGATKLINIFKVFYETEGVRKTAIFSDFPGFGFSKVSRSVSHGWKAMIENYILRNSRIRSVVWLFDVRREMDELDEMLMEWLAKNDIEVCLVLTKCDKEVQGKIVKKKRLFNESFEWVNVIACSSKTGQGKEELLSYLEKVLA